MKFSKMLWMACSFAALMVFSGCQTNAPAGIVCGREWNPGAQTVADTTSTFDLKDPLIIQYNYGKGFDFTELTISFYAGTIEKKINKIWSYSAAVNPKLASYTMQGKSKNGDLMTARELTRHKNPGSVVVEFSNGEQVLMAKEITLVKNK